ncbi:MAG: hypothetical protein ACLP6E_17810 [Acidimicrobiales bacterium]
MSGICRGNRNQMAILSARLPPFCVDIASCRLAGHIATSRAAEAMPAHLSRRHRPIGVNVEGWARWITPLTLNAAASIHGR